MNISAGGLICAVGMDADSACAAIRANISGFADTPYHDNFAQPIVAAMAPDLDVQMKRADRILLLLTTAIQDLLERTKGLATTELPLLVGLAEPGRPGGAAGLAGTVVRQVEERLGVKFHSASRAIPTGHTAGLEALRHARDLFRTAKVRGCVVAAADSYINASSLQWLDRHDRLKTEANSDGVIPGEAGAAVLVTAAPLGSGPSLRVRGLGFAEEKAHVLNDEPILGLGMAAAAKQALTEAGLQMHDIDLRISDVSGEQYGFKELALVLPRLMRERREKMPLWHPAQSIGDTGAAASVAGMIVMREAIVKDYAIGSRAMMFASSLGGARAVMVFERG